jgi:23S rRNA (guanosine2251-2'-O)-methyltransferase
MEYKNKKNSREKDMREERTRENEDGSVIVGRNPVLELLKSGRGIEKIYILKGEREGSVTKIFAEARARGINVAETDKQKLDMLAGGNAHQGVAAIASAKEYVTLEQMVAFAAEKGEKPLIVVCDGVEDPHNIGAIIRCAEGAGAHGLVIGKRHAPAIGQTVFKASAGAAEHLPIAKVTNIANAIEELKELGVWTFAAEAGGADYHSTDFDLPCAIVMGSEGGGVSRLVKEKCDFLVSIPMYGKVNSLNVSTAASVLLFDAAFKQRNK